MTVELPFVSVIIPTRNRSGLLRQTVETFAAQTYPPDRWELILVDNNSTDDTWSVIQSMAARGDRVRALREPRRGAHFARNTGAGAARGSVLYFTDDDMLADPQLLERIIEGFAADPRVASVTGRVLPRWETEPPLWVLEHCRNALLSLNDLGESLIVSDEDPGVFSCHQAVLRDVFIRAGGFNPDTNAELFTGDNETGLNIKIQKLGYGFAYVGAAVTHHMIPASRMTQRYLNSRLADQGFCDSYTDYRAIHPGRARLAKRIAAHSALIGVTAAKAFARRAAGDTRWRLDLARIYYHRNRARYDARLLRDERWRAFALRDDWLGDISGRPHRSLSGGRRTRGESLSGTPEKPLVSIVTAVFNGARHIEETIRAVAAQTYAPIEHIIVDGGSTDGTVEILRRYDDSIAYWVSEPDSGVYDAMNKGIDLVGDPESYILFANSDDHLYSPEAVERVISTSAGEDLVYGRMVLSDGQISTVAGRRVEIEDLAIQTLCHPATFVRKKVFDSVGKFDTRYVIAADYDHIVRCFAAPVSTRFVDVIVSRMRMGGLSEERFLLSCRERKDVIRRRFPLLPRLRGIWQVNLYDIPRNAARRWIDRAGLLGHWRALKGS